MSKSYKLKTIADLCTIPKESLQNCLIDVRACIESYHSMNELAKTEFCKVLPIQEIEWIDDGEHDITINLESIVVPHDS
jgi:hypothetical protein